MKINIDYLDNEVEFNEKNIFSLEIRNKKYLYRISSLFHALSNGQLSENIICMDNQNNEINLSNKIRFFTNYFDFEFNSKKYSNDLAKYVLLQIEQYESTAILSAYNKVCKLVNRELGKIDLPLSIDSEESLESIIKSMKISIQDKGDLLDNLLLIIDLENLFKTNKLLCFINLKQYLTKEELIEFYKYATYNNVKILMIETEQQSYIKEYERILVIDSNLDEYVLE